MPTVGYESPDQAPRPPYIRFEKRALEKRKTLEEGGETYYINRDFAIVTPAGSKETVEKEVDVWFPYLKEQVRQGRFDQRWYDAYTAAYKAWANDQEPPLNGIDIRNWAVASPAEIKMLVALRVLTVEDMAAANEELMMRIGMGARSLKQKALDYLTAKKDIAPLVQQLDAMRHTLAGLESRCSILEQRNKELELTATSRPPPEIRYEPLRAPEPPRVTRQELEETAAVDSAVNEALG